MITAYNLHNGKVLCKTDLMLRAIPYGRVNPVTICDKDDMDRVGPDFIVAMLVDSMTFKGEDRPKWSWKHVSATPGISKNLTVWYWSLDTPSSLEEALAPIFKEIDEDYLDKLQALNDRRTKRLIALYDFMKERM